MTTRDDSSQKIGAPKAGMSTKAVSQIVDATGIPLKTGVHIDLLRVAINHLVTEVTVLSLSRDPRGARREIEQLKRALETYQNLTNTLPAFDLFPPKPPADWRAAVLLWITNTVPDISTYRVDLGV